MFLSRWVFTFVLFCNVLNPLLLVDVRTSIRSLSTVIADRTLRLETLITETNNALTMIGPTTNRAVYLVVTN